MTTPLTHVGQTAHPEISPQPQQQRAGGDQQPQAQPDVQKQEVGDDAQDAVSGANTDSAIHPNDE